MKLEFKLYKANEESRLYKLIQKSPYKENEFIIVGEEKDYYKVLQMTSKGILLIGGLPLDEVCLLTKKDDLIISGSKFCCDTVEIDIPKKYLNMTIIENIQRLNE